MSRWSWDFSNAMNFLIGIEVILEAIPKPCIDSRHIDKEL